MNCPICKKADSVMVAYSEVTSYPAIEIAQKHGGDFVDTDPGESNMLDSEFSHIYCEACGSRWESVTSFIVPASTKA